jgi:sugar phosphate isomerase/epimerase
MSAPAAPIAVSAKPFDAPFGSSVDGALHELGRRADRYGVVVAFGSELASFAAVGRALAAAACPWFGIDLDPVAMLRDAWPPDEIFSRLGNLIRHVRARDALLGADKRTKPATIGTGSVQWNELLAKFTDAAYSRWLTIDPTDLPQRAAAANRNSRTETADSADGRG